MFDWRVAFFINVPLAALGVLVAITRPPESRNPDAPARFYPLTVYYDFWDSNEDFEYAKEDSHVVEPQFYSGLSYRTVSDGDAPLGNAIVGDAVCHFGRTTGRSCGTVQAQNFDPGNICGPSLTGDCAPTWILVQGPNLLCGSGDSGGPWYVSGRAYGTMQSGDPVGGGPACDGAVFMRTQYVDARNFDILEG